MTAINQWRHPVVRDLAWVMASPSLISDVSHAVDDVWCRDVFDASLSALQRLDVSPAPLLSVLEKDQSHRLGRYFEVLVAYWLGEIIGSEIVAQNLTISDDSRQLGEFDLLFRDRVTQRVMHWELSVKFYLKYGDQFIGPNSQDTLYKKMTKVFESQLLLSQREEACEQLKPLIADEPVYPAAFIKGRLFYPAKSNWRNPEIIEGISPDHSRGWWCYHGELSRWVSQCDVEHRWMILEKMEWLSSVVRLPEAREETTGLMTSRELSHFINNYFVRAYKALMVTELEYRQGYWIEVSRGVVVDDSWPNAS